ncbi:MAG TPA: response regulator [Burkholderiales bacterium]
MPPSYRLTGAGRLAWESQDAAVPADYRLILWLLDFHGNDYAASAFRRFPEQLLIEWLGEMEELGLIERAPDEALRLPLPDIEVLEDEVPAQEMLARGGAYIAEHRLRGRRPPGKPRSRIVVLIVEDDPDQLALADLRVSMAGYSVRVAASAEALTRSFSSDGPPDLLLLDIHLPDGDGFDILWKLRRHRRYAELPVILLTARADAEDIGKGLRLGADGYVTKPYSKNLLAGVIEKVLKHVHA